MSENIHILIVEDNKERRKKIGRIFRSSADKKFKIEFQSNASAAKISSAKFDFDIAMISFEPDPQSALLAAWRFRSIRPDIGIAVLALSIDFLAPVEMIELGLGPLVVLDDEGLASLPSVASALTDIPEEKSPGLTTQSNLRLRHKELRDITDSLARQSVNLIHLKNELAAEKNKVEAVINGMTDGMMFFDAADKLELINPIARKLFSSLKPVDGIALTRFKFFLKDKIIPRDKAVKSGPDVSEIEINNKIYRVREALVADPQNDTRGSLMMFTDITHDKEYEKLKNDFTNMISHELRTPLTSIRAAVDNLLRGNMGAVTDDQCKFLEIIARNVDRQQQLIDNMLDLARFEAGLMETVKEKANLSSVVAMCVEQFSPAFKDKNVSLELNVKQAVPMIMIDPNLITQAVNNLLSNALKFTNKEDHVSVSIDRAKLDGVERACITVADTGIGIPDDKVGSIFDKYMQVEKGSKRRSSGAGLGLAICEEIARAHGGSITVESEENRGSRFKIYIPLNSKIEKK